MDSQIYLSVGAKFIQLIRKFYHNFKYLSKNLSYYKFFLNGNKLIKL